MKKVILTREECYYLQHLHNRVIYAHHREGFEQFNTAQLEYQDEVRKLKEKYGIDLHLAVQRIDFTSEYMLVEDSIYGEI